MAVHNAEKENLQAQIVALEDRIEKLFSAEAGKKINGFPTKETAELPDDSGVLTSHARCAMSTERNHLFSEGTTPSSNEFMQNLMVSSSHLANTMSIMANIMQMQNKGACYNFFFY